MSYMRSSASSRAPPLLLSSSIQCPALILEIALDNSFRVCVGGETAAEDEGGGGEEEDDAVCFVLEKLRRRSTLLVFPNGVSDDIDSSSFIMLMLVLMLVLVGVDSCIPVFLFRVDNFTNNGNARNIH
jgi:hypothetical protein